MIFFTGEKLSYQHFDWQYGFLDVKKIALSFCSQHGRRVWKGAKGLFGFYVKKKKSLSHKKHETERRTASTHYFGKITKK